MFATWLAAFNSGDLAPVREFDRTYRHEGGAPIPPPQATLDFRERTGGFTLLRFERQEPTSIVALLQERNLDTVARMELSVTAGDPPAIAKTTLRAIPRPDDLAVAR